MQKRTIRIANPVDAATLVPYLLGYQPQNSLAMLAVEDGQLRLAGAQALPDGDDPRPLGHHLADVLLSNGLNQALLIGYGPHEPMTDAVDTAIAVFTDRGITVLDAMRVGEGRLWHLGCDEPHCTIKSLPYDPASTIVAAEATYAGMQIAVDRDALATRLAPISGADQQRMNAAILAAVHTLAQPLRTDDRLGERIATLVAEALTAARQDSQLSDDHAAQLLILLAFAHLRDAAVPLVHGSRHHIAVWSDLTRRAGAGSLACAPAIFLALAAVQAGDGVTAVLAADRACQADPGDEFAELVQHVIHSGISPEAVHQALHRR
ncbi:DUF4192 domain-containing protein [Actinoplanes awajinensis]|uniref:DUF4192 domain-containing protein n=1 Tax=Actinoplanes awajinensis subsp. mycoplanecinus TaxID=135947 RepID=A0A101JFF1_9ACTN|nr:DUF4192 domain-containing protein [Actinoplanes awajinensis]KUL25831.1 hypothetical protein ADL15_39685 [Actinoplanes awajinensis subsp. mycoplanecinus]